jgi:hypothetical protein
MGRGVGERAWKGVSVSKFGLENLKGRGYIRGLSIRFSQFSMKLCETLRYDQEVREHT